MKRRSRDRGRQISFWILSLAVVLSMAFGLIISILPQPSPPTPKPSIPIAIYTATPQWTSPTATIFTATPTSTRPIPGLTPVPIPPTPVIIPSFMLSPTVPSQSESSPWPSATCDQDEAFSFAVAGDSRDGEETYRRLLERVASDSCDFLIHTGDMVSRGGEHEFQAFGRIMADFDLPFYPVAGNHDAQGGRLDAFLRYSGAPARHYSFDCGLVHFALADSHNGYMSSNELAWLKADLVASYQPVKMVFLHHPPFDPHGGDHIMAGGNEAFMALMKEQGVAYVFAGHIHAYAQETRDGTTYVITGGAGAPLYEPPERGGFYHYVRVTVQGEEVSTAVVRLKP